MKRFADRLLDGRTPRERLVIVGVLAVVMAVLYVLWVQVAQRARRELSAGVVALRGQARNVASQSNEIERLRRLPQAAAGQLDLRALVQRQAGASGIARGLQRMETPEPGRVQVACGAGAFSDGLGWVGALQAQQLRVETCRVEAMTTPGLVNVTVTLVRTGAR